MDRLLIDRLIIEALKEDMPYGDVTTDNVFDDSHMSEAFFVAKQSGIICGVGVAKRVFEILDETLVTDHELEDGEPVKEGDIILEIRGRTKALLKGERTALNLIQRMSGISTTTWEYVKEAEGYGARITDTRKTTPMLRYLEKYAVTIGGGHNHRFSLSDAAMLKDNHIDALGGMIKAVSVLRKKLPHTMKIEVEADSMEKVSLAIEAKADIIMLDNMSIEQMKKAVEYINKRAVVEASGNVTKEKIRAIAQTGVDIISSGKLTHSVQALDISMKIRKNI